MEDTTNPNAICQNITIQLNASGNASITASQINNSSTDSCSTITLSASQTAFDCSDLGTNNVTLTVTDASGNIDTCIAVVTVEDNINPLTPTLATINGQCSATAPIPTTTDNCGGTIIGTTSNPTTYNTQGAHIITWNFNDGNGNSINVDQTVFINDTIDPVAVCQNLTVSLDDTTGTATITASQINNGSTDNCGTGSLTYTLSQSTFDCTDIGPNIITFTVQDAGGNTDTCTATVTVTSPSIDGGTLIGYLVDGSNTPIETNPTASNIIQVTACPDEPQYAYLTLSGYIGNISGYEVSTDGGLTWNPAPNSTTNSSYTTIAILQTTLVRAIINIGACEARSNITYVAVIPPDVPPTIIGPTDFDICLGTDITVVAQSEFGINPDLTTGGLFNTANLNNLGWLVDGNATWEAGNNNTDPSPWRGTNGPNEYTNRCYDNISNDKFTIAHGINGTTTLETPIFNTLGLTTATLEFDQAYYFTAGATASIMLSLNDGVTYPITLNPGPGVNYNGPSDSGFALHNMQGNRCDNVLSDFIDNHVSIDLQDYIGRVGLRIMFVFNCNTTSSWGIDNITIPQAPIDEVIEWTDENGVVVTTGSTTTITPITPGVQTYGVTSLINGCRSDGDEGTEFIQVSASLAYAGENIAPTAGECGESTVQLKAYDNTLTALQNYANGVWDSNYHLPVLANGDTDYPGTGENGFWSAVPLTIDCASSARSFSNVNNPNSTFTAEPGTYRLTWTVAGCTSSIDVTINNCDSVDFDGVDDYVLFDDNYDVSGNFSIEAWVKPESISGERTIISKRDANNLATGYDLKLSNNGTVSFNWNNSGSINSLPYKLTTSRWYHLGIVFNSGTYTLYIDGVEIKTGGGSAPTPNNMKCILGAMDQANNAPNKPVKYFSGWLDEVRIWNNAITTNQLRHMMNQQIMNNGGSVAGEVVPLDIPGLSWANLDGYYRMNINCGTLTPYAGAVAGKLRNIFDLQEETAPIPYTSRVDGQNWSTDNTWTHFNVWDAPNSNGINGIPIDWNIVQISHNIDSGNKDITVLGLISDTQNKELTISNPSNPQNETNTGQMLWVTHYLDLDGKIDLVGESQLIQKRYNSSQVNESFFNNTSLGYIERDQQGTVNPFNYNYWSSPVAPNNATTDINNNSSNTYSIGSILRDGTTTVANPMGRPISWTGGYTAAANNPAQVSTRWLYAYINNPAEDYYSWEYIGNTTSIPIGLGYTMKGSGNATANQNYVFVGKPNNGTITSPIGATQQSLVGNPYPSAIDSREFITDNGPSGTNSITGTLYFWEHYTSNATHITELYEGGYAALNFTGGVGAVQHPDLILSSNGTKIPERYIPVGQGFFVEGGSSNGQVTFNNSQRIYKTEAFTADSYEGSVFIRSANNSNNYTEELIIKRLRLQFTSPEGARRPLLLGFVPNELATDGVDWAYDGRNNDESTNSDMSWVINFEKYVIQGVGDFDIEKQFPLHVFLETSGNFEISLTDLENFENDINVFVYDSYLGTYTQINNEAFQLTAEAGEYSNRFFITFQSNTLNVTENVYTDDLLVNYLNNSDEIYINVPNSIQVKQVFLLQMLGQTVNSWEITNAHAYLSLPEIRIPVKGITDGNYIIKVITEDNQTISKKVIIKQ
ncbi:LamG-like jellyroll fold domain-containing protein [Formosa maritima]|uniref:HYR domain-containing protein n=1 Tax=Formosa maritima TaxID=2592046 RepID=A0A5D0G5Z6_9FLAO|nr:LamG-like jellyroll fold domain-containing protein [Formosa maritima]TYA54308.1 hypothetical protein FVF61_08810 [Formosa maritima]